MKHMLLFSVISTIIATNASLAQELPTLKTKEEIKNKAILTLSMQRPNLNIDDLFMAMIDIVYVFNDDTRYQRLEGADQPYAWVTFCLRSTIDTKVGESGKSYDRYKTVKVAVGPLITPKTAAVIDSFITTNVPHVSMEKTKAETTRP